MLDLPPPTTPDWIHWLKHKETYGPVSSVTVMGQTIVILNDVDSAMELLGKRSTIYSSRANLVFPCELVGWDRTLVMQKYSPHFRSSRKAIHQFVGTVPAAAQFHSLQEIEAHRFLLRVLQDQSRLAEHIQTESGAILLKMAYGYTIEPHKRDPLVRGANLALDHFAESTAPGSRLVNIIPSLKYVPTWLPGAGFKRTAKVWRKNLDAVADIPYLFARQHIESDIHQTSYLSKLLKAAGYPPYGSAEDSVAKWTAASLYTGGVDTSVSAMEVFFLAMTLYPEVQHKAQDELDRVLGPCQLPTFADRPRLPYINAIVKEVLRWHPVGPMGFPHASTEDDTWGQYFIPKGSLVMPNAWAMTHDPAVYHDPMTFKPERFLGIDGREPELDPHTIVFGFGRRICPARLLADNTVYVTAARALAVFNVRKAIEDGREVDVEARFEAKTISHPMPWKLYIETRSKTHEALIRSVEQKTPFEPSNASDLPNFEL
ncbi:hypothetical protein N7457_005813 [Penicillium paradoxum]|uniref:uncharacterized protein n=1 Tax=Penicillium paradoxum TaxID=176176 RepID=UPI002546F38F|nr:uncharacterized protein N7457_005813 [Penicillium paradoxum]KAJ5780653.1 hypothetical protein N7457_005813 [Penicillium paradoxum]